VALPADGDKATEVPLVLPVEGSKAIGLPLVLPVEDSKPTGLTLVLELLELSQELQMAPEVPARRWCPAGCPKQVVG
jgi:hypothetical protein